MKCQFMQIFIKQIGIPPVLLCASFMLFCGFILTNCETDEPQYRLTPSERSKADTIYLEYIDTLTAFADSLCTSLKEERLQIIVDSIIDLRQREAEALKDRNRATDGIK